MSTADWSGVAAIYLPLAAALVAGLLHWRQARLFASCLLSLLWAVPSLVVVQALNVGAGWWSFGGDGVRFHGMPVECIVGWALLWGAVPQLAFPRLRLGWVAVIMGAADLVLMPVCGALVHLGPRWLIGEVVAIFLVLAPALLVARWTLENTRLAARSALQIATSGMLFLYFVPEVVFALRPGAGWTPLLKLPGWELQISVQAVLVLALPGVSAVMEFAQRGRGTPIPYDPPQRLVTSGVYRYCANPMQVSCAAVMLLWAGILQNGWLVLAAAMAAIYSAGIARWDEAEDLSRRFGEPWHNYRAEVHDWGIRWRPYHAGPPARVYIATTCGPCSELRAWLERSDPLGLQIVAAETLSTGSIQRMRYVPEDGSSAVEGVRAMGRALEHINIGWAMAGAALRLPVVWQGVQLLMDASGLGPRALASCETAPTASKLPG